MSNDRTPTDLPELPEGWVETDVGSLMSLIQYGHTASASARATGPRFLRITDIQDGRVDWGTVPSCDLTVEEQEKYRLRPGDLVFARTGATTGKSYLIRTPPDAVFASYLIRLRTTQGIDPAFVYWFFQSASYWSQISKGKRGVGQPNVNATILASLQAPVAPSSEQHRIVAKLDELFSELDAGVAALERARAKLKRYRASVLKAAVEGKMTEEWRQENPPDETGEELLERILVERRKHWEEEQLAKFKAQGRKPPKNWKAKYREPGVPDTSGLPEVPEGWCWATVDQVAEVTGGLTKNPARSRLPVKYPYLRVANVYADEIRLDDVRTIGASKSELDRVVLRPGDLLVVEGNGSADQIGRVAEWQGDFAPCCHQNHLIKVRCAGSTYRSRWMLLWLLSPAGRRAVLKQASSTSGLYTLSLSKIKALHVPLAPIREQARVVGLADSLCDAARVVQEQVEAETAICASALRQSILKRAFEGRLVPQDPNDEPASLLLERIRVSREAERPKKSRRSTASTERIQNS